MDFFSKLGETITETGKDVSQKVVDLTGIAKLNLDIRGKEEFVQRQYAEIGRQYYELHKDDEEPFFQEVERITETLKEIERLRGEMAQRKGKKRCASCGAVNEADAVYCNRCGTKCESIFEDEDESAQTQEVEEAKEEVVIEELETEMEEGIEEDIMEDIKEE